MGHMGDGAHGQWDTWAMGIVDNLTLLPSQGRYPLDKIGTSPLAKVGTPQER